MHRCTLCMHTYRKKLSIGTVQILSAVCVHHDACALIYNCTYLVWLIVYGWGAENRKLQCNFHTGNSPGKHASLGNLNESGVHTLKTKQSMFQFLRGDPH